jgi:hypothetical protein
MLLGLMVVATLAKPELEAEESADPQYYSKYEPKYPSYPKPSYKPSYPAHPAYPDYKPSYDHSYKKENYYCDPRTPPKCANASATFCLSDYEYPAQDIQVISILKKTTKSGISYVDYFSTPSSTTRWC